MRYFFLCLIFILLNFTAFSQTTYPQNGVSNEKSAVVKAYINAKIYPYYLNSAKNQSIVVQEDKIIAVGTDIKIPKNAFVVDLKGQYIYPSFIDLWADYSILKPERKENNEQKVNYERLSKGPLVWNEALKPEFSAVQNYQIDEESSKKWMEKGFGAVLSHHQDGIARGSGFLCNTGMEKEVLNLIDEETATFYSFSKGNSKQAYPSSLMGAIALLRQFYYDGNWYENHYKSSKEKNISLGHYVKNKTLPAFFDAGNDLHNLFRIKALEKEFNQQYFIKATGKEYQQIEKIKDFSGRLILPIKFPLAPKVNDAYDLYNVSYTEMKHWEMAPLNPKLLHDNKVRFAITSEGFDKADDFFSALKKINKAGLASTEIIDALTMIPAAFINKEMILGSLEAGKKANFFTALDSLMGDNFKIVNHYTNGVKHQISTVETKEIAGVYTLRIDTINEFEISIKNSLTKTEATAKRLKSEEKAQKINIERDGNFLGFAVNMSKDSTKKEMAVVSLRINYKSKILDGHAILPNGDWAVAYAVKQAGKEVEKKEKKEADSTRYITNPVLYPLVAYGNLKHVEKKNYVIKNATVWTSDSLGILENTDVKIIDGKITEIGQDLLDYGFEIIDGTGKHITPGFIDEHSHIAIKSGVNEGGESITSEVRIGDVINPDDINIYRQLAGGVTTVQLLHGSANTIGGQSSIIQLKWGELAENLKFKNQKGYIKFALGENVKQSNWGDKYKTRYPQTRMGVEQVLYDGFYRARAYEETWKDYSKKVDTKTKREAIPPTPRRDLELDALVEILNNERFITCHSYVQPEIHMLMEVADSLGFKINTFTHILEGYKIADKMKEHGVGASTFSDWWAYKFEVNDAIPHNAAILNAKGIVTAINSDDAEMGRRLNHEAAKTVKYGGVSEEDALKMITINPAKLLRIDDKVGSLKVGKQADLVIWNEHPLSIYAKAEKTFIEGAKYFDWEEWEEKKDFIAKEKAELIGKILRAIENGEKTKEVEKKKDKHYHCDTVLDNYEEF